VDLKQKIKYSKKIKPELKERLLEVYDKLNPFQRKKIISMLLDKNELLEMTLLEIQQIGKNYAKDIREEAEKREAESN